MFSSFFFATMDALKIVTLNCWAIPISGVSKMRTQRIAAIGEELSKGDYHIVVLEEIWSKSDYKQLFGMISPVMPYSHYFYSGFIGSGICVFSKVPFLETFFHRFHLNGQAYKVHHGDWFGGKGVGLCKLIFQGFRINLYVTHIHAEYCRADDEYLPHRISQAFEMSQFIRLTAQDCDIVLAAGDFNLEPSDVGYKLLVTNTPLYDAWENKKNVPESNKVGSTCECPWNIFRDKSLAFICPDGKRIDYIMYCGQPGVEVTVSKCWITLQQVPNAKFPFSDHEGVAAEFSFERTSSDAVPISLRSHPRLEDGMQYLQKALHIVHRGAEQVSSTAVHFQIVAVSLTVILYWLFHTDFAASNPQPIPLLAGLGRLVVVVAVAVLVWLSTVVKGGEAQGLRATELDIENLLALRANGGPKVKDD